MSLSRYSLHGPLPPIEHKEDGTTYKMTPSQRKRANALIRRECCNCDSRGNCMLLHDGQPCPCPQMNSYTILCKWFRHVILPMSPELEAEIFRDGDMKSCAVCGARFMPKSNRAKYCPACAEKVHRRQKTESERKRRSGVDG